MNRRRPRGQKNNMTKMCEANTVCRNVLKFKRNVNELRRYHAGVKKDYARFAGRGNYMKGPIRPCRG